jgi:hypothetical protein
MSTARRLARRFDAGRSSLRDATDLHDAPDRAPGFDAWLSAFWRSDCPPEPDTCPDAVSFLGGANGGGAIRWYEADGAVAGYLPGIPRRCFWVPSLGVEPAFDDVLADDGSPCHGDDHLFQGVLPPAQGVPG